MHHFNLTESREGGGECNEHTVCEDLLLAILAKMDSKSLVALRRVSRIFVVLVDEVLRGRFLKIATCDSTNIIIESKAVYNPREACRQPLTFSHFVDSAFPVEGMTAHFSVATREPLYLPLDDHEVFANNLLDVTLESTEPKPMLQEIMMTQPRTFNMPYTRAAGNSNPPPRFFSDFSWQLSIASSLDRLFREWFVPDVTNSSNDDEDREGAVIRRSSIESGEDEDILSLSPSPSPPSSSSSRETSPPVVSRPSRIRLLEPSNNWPTSSRVPSAFKSASLECLSHEGATAPEVWRYGPPPPAGPGHLEFEYYIDSICLDVGKVVVAAEEGLKGKARNPFILFA